MVEWTSREEMTTAAITTLQLARDRRHITEAFVANSEDVSAWELAGLQVETNVTLRVHLECGIVELRRSCTSETKMNNTSVQRRRLAPTVFMTGERQSSTRNTESERPILAVSVIDARFQQTSQQWRACTVPQSQ